MNNAWTDAHRREEEWPIKLVIGKDLPQDDEDLPIRTGRLMVTTGIRQPSGDFGPYFSTTAELVDRTKHHSEWGVIAGPQHDLIVKYFPELEPLVQLHPIDVDAVPARQANEAVDHLLELGATDNRVATAAQQALEVTNPSRNTATASANEDARTVMAEPYTARQCPECETWVYVADGPFAEGDRTKTVADWLHWERLHLDPEDQGTVIEYPFFNFNETPVEATVEPTTARQTSDEPVAQGKRAITDRLDRLEHRPMPEPPDLCA